MKPPHIFRIIVFAFCAIHVLSLENQALFVKNDYLQRGKRVTRQTSADQMVQNILQWLQGVYTQNSRRIRQGTLREYLPPSNTQKPRPFGYPPAGITPQPPFPIYTNPTTGAVTGEGGYPSPNNEITPPDQQPNYNGYPSSAPPQPPFPSSPLPTGYPSGPSTFSTSERPITGYPSSTAPPSYTTGYPTQRPGFSTVPPQGYTTSQQPGYPSSGYPTERPGLPGFPTAPPTGYPEASTPRPFSTDAPSSPRPGFSTVPPTQPPTELPTLIPSTSSPITSAPGTQPSPTVPPEHFTSAVSTTPENQPAVTTPQPEDNNVIPTDSSGKDNTATDTENNEDLKHPPHIHAIDVQCAKDMMTINIEFNRQFDGVIYSKGYYNMPECRYVKENSGQKKYSFTVNLNTCGTEFINAFDTQGQSYLENVLVLQNEPGIQEVWDTIRSVRCLWEGNLKESLSVSLSVGMLSQEIVTFSGDTAMAKLDIQTGKGPFAQSANGLVKIGEPMTLVVSVTGDPGFDIQVKDCRATDSTGDNVVPLTDDNGCVLKPKLFGAFQKTRNTGSTGASIIAYAFFNAFKFPDVMDLMIECNIELCKTDCEMCTDPNQKTEPGRRRRRRDLYSFNETIADGVTMGKHIRVILPEDLNDKTVINLSQNDGVCMSTQNFVFSSALLISLLATSCLFSAYMWLKNQRLSIKL